MASREPTLAAPVEITRLLKALAAQRAVLPTQAQRSVIDHVVSEVEAMLARQKEIARAG